MRSRPNFLIFMTDQQNGETILPGSVAKAKTPNLDRFRQQSVTFSHAYTPSPHCCPSRASFFTGLFPSQHGVWNNVLVGNALSRGVFEGIRFFSEDLRDNGYQLDYSGKYHVSYFEPPASRGWTAHSIASGPVSAKPPSGPLAEAAWKFYPPLAPDPAENTQPGVRLPGQIIRPGYPDYCHYSAHEDPMHDRQFVEEGIGLIHSRQPNGQPWCQMICTNGPHDPYTPPQRFIDLYDLEDIHLPSSWSDLMADKPAFYRRTREVFNQLSEAEQREALRHYLAFCSYEDHLFGRVIEALESTGQLDNTVVIYLSDHGDYRGAHGLWCKGLPSFQEAYHIPLVIRVPDALAAGTTTDTFVQLPDLAPTLLDLAGIAPNREFAGRSLRPWLEDQTSPAPHRDAIFTQSNGNELYGLQRSIMTREWKFVYNGFDYDELYNLRKDPEETKNLAGDPEYREVCESLMKRIWSFARAHGDVCTNPYIMVGFGRPGPGSAPSF